MCTDFYNELKYWTKILSQIFCCEQNSVWWYMENVGMSSHVNSVLSKTHAYEWYNAFKKIIEGLPHSGRPSTSSTKVDFKKVDKIVLENRHSSFRKKSHEHKKSHEGIRSMDRCNSNIMIVERIITDKVACFYEFEIEIRKHRNREQKTMRNTRKTPNPICYFSPISLVWFTRHLLQRVKR